ncbi:MAG: sensor histidine kinase [Syntrophothermus sp.]
MTGSLKKIGVILVAIILLPGIFFSIYEIGTLNSSEKVIEEIYNNQLDAILYSVNQYAEDLTGAWISRISSGYMEQRFRPGALNNEIAKLESENPVHALVLADDVTGKGLELHIASPNSNDPKLQAQSKLSSSEIRKIFANLGPRVDRLIIYKKGGYRKIESVQTAAFGNSVLLFFLLDNQSSYKICGIFIDPNAFIAKSLGPKMQEISSGKFVVSVVKGADNRQVYSTENNDSLKSDIKKQLWLLPDYYLSIMLKGDTISDLVRSRYYLNLTLIVLLNLVLIAGVWFVFRNIRKEVQLAQIKSDFVSNVSHELRTPLALISMYAETLELGRVRTEERKQEYYTIISQEAGRLSRIVNKILSFSQIEAGRRKFNFTEINLNEIAGKIYNTYSYHMQSEGFKFILEPCSNCPPVKADSEAVGEALINLIDNAAKYSTEEKEIHIKSGMNREYAFLEVSDRGIGISAENQKRIFEKFYRVTSGNVHNTKGTGLGLALVKHIMDVHKGFVTVESSPGHGSTFRLNFSLNNKTAGII